MLAKRFQTSVEQILLANSGIDPYQLRVGQILVIPSPIKLPLTTLGFIEPYNPEAFLANFEQLAHKTADPTYAAGFWRALLASAALAGRQRERGHRRPRPDDHVLPAVEHVGHRRRAPDRRAGRVVPEVLPGARVERHEVAFVVAARTPRPTPSTSRPPTSASDT